MKHESFLKRASGIGSKIRKGKTSKKVDHNYQAALRREFENKEFVVILAPSQTGHHKKQIEVKVTKDKEETPDKKTTETKEILPKKENTFVTTLSHAALNLLYSIMERLQIGNTERTNFLHLLVKWYQDKILLNQNYPIKRNIFDGLQPLPLSFNSSRISATPSQNVAIGTDPIETILTKSIKTQCDFRKKLEKPKAKKPIIKARARNIPSVQHSASFRNMPSDQLKAKSRNMLFDQPNTSTRNIPLDQPVSLIAFPRRREYNRLTMPVMDVSGTKMYDKMMRRQTKSKKQNKDPLKRQRNFIAINKALASCPPSLYRSFKPMQMNTLNNNTTNNKPKKYNRNFLEENIQELRIRSAINTIEKNKSLYFSEKDTKRIPKRRFQKRSR